MPSPHFQIHVNWKQDQDLNQHQETLGFQWIRYNLWKATLEIDKPTREKSRRSKKPTGALDIMFERGNRSDWDCNRFFVKRMHLRVAFQNYCGILKKGGHVVFKYCPKVRAVRTRPADKKSVEKRNLDFKLFYCNEDTKTGIFDSGSSSETRWWKKLLD